jgi:hypothetical protein
MEVNKTRSITELLTSASLNVMPASGRKPWAYGWAFSDYRHSDQSALEGLHGPVTLNNEGIDAFEEAVTRLLKEQKIRDRWDVEEFWWMLASIVVIASEEGGDPNDFIGEEVEALRTVGPALTIQLISNVVWNQPPLLLDNAVIGDAGIAFVEFVNASARRRSQVSSELARKWLDKEILPRMADNGDAPPAAIACWTVGQENLADEQTERQLRNIVNLAILLEHDLRAHEAYRRGETNRPGIRGLTLDRGAIERGLKKSARLELASSPLRVSSLGAEGGTSWFNAEPLRLGTLLAQQYLRDGVESCLKVDPVSNRLRVAARWFAEAHYTLNDDDAVLALGVAMDAILSGQRALPGSVMADRFALLTPDPKQRRPLITKYMEFYSARSSIAHGGKTSKLAEPSFVDEYQKAVHWAALRSLALRDEFKVQSEKDVEALYDDLRLGARSWKKSHDQVPLRSRQGEKALRPHGVAAPTDSWRDS